MLYAIFAVQPVHLDSEGICAPWISRVDPTTPAMAVETATAMRERATVCTRTAAQGMCRTSTQSSTA